MNVVHLQQPRACRLLRCRDAACPVNLRKPSARFHSEHSATGTRCVRNGGAALRAGGCARCRDAHELDHRRTSAGPWASTHARKKRSNVHIAAGTSGGAAATNQERRPGAPTPPSTTTTLTCSPLFKNVFQKKFDALNFVRQVEFDVLQKVRRKVRQICRTKFDTSRKVQRVKRFL